MCGLSDGVCAVAAGHRDNGVGFVGDGRRGAHWRAGEQAECSAGHLLVVWEQGAQFIFDDKCRAKAPAATGWLNDAHLPYANELLVHALEVIAGGIGWQDKAAQVGLIAGRGESPILIGNADHWIARGRPGGQAPFQQLADYLVTQLGSPCTA